MVPRPISPQPSRTGQWCPDAFSSPAMLDAHPLNTDPERQRLLLATRDGELVAQWGLLLSAVAIPYVIDQQDTTYHLTVNEHDLPRAREEIRLYYEENVHWPRPSSAQTTATSHSTTTPLILLCGLILFFFETGPVSPHSFWFQAGTGDADAILRAGEWWRLVTPLTLHADLSHLLGNCLLGGFLLSFLCGALGNGLALLAMLIAAVSGNLINVLLHGGDHRFVGFSTAVFSLIGILAMLSSFTRAKQKTIHYLLPFMAGAACLAMLGSSGARTDLGAHLFGLLTGLLVGFLLSRCPLDWLRKSLLFQTLCTLLFLYFVISSWQLALKHL